MEKCLIFSHESDIDGLGSIILGKIAFGEIDYVLVPSVASLENKFRELLEYGELDKYDSIYVTDLTLYNPSAYLVKNNPNIAKKVLVFDHHKTAINDGYSKYDFMSIVEEDNTGKRRCGTDLFYEFLLSNNLIDKITSIDDFVELTRLEDTWEWKKNGEIGEKAHDLAILFNIIGVDEYINKMYSKLVNLKETFEFDEDEKSIIKKKKEDYLKQLQQLWSESETFIDELNNKFSAVFAGYEYRNELAEYVRTLGIDGLKYLIIIALEKGNYGQKSYRSIEESFDVGRIAEEHGGGGHPSAASVNITKEQKEYALTLKNNNKRASLEFLVNSSYKE
jgi:hypothetical protein